MPIDGHALGFELKPALRAYSVRRLHFVTWGGCVGLLFLTHKLCNRADAGCACSH
jgi:hypothetical protein